MSNNDGEVLLNELLNNAIEAEETKSEASKHGLPAAVPTPVEEPQKPANNDSHTQWALGGNGRFSPVGSTAVALPSGIYEPFAMPGMWGLERLNVESDGIYTLPDMATETILKEVQTFWNSEEKYRKHGLLYKRGVILWGPPGGGKTVAVKVLMNELVKREGIVVVANNISLTILCLKAIRRIEPKRNLIVVMEDIDEIIQYNGEGGVLSMLDGENNVDNVLHLATTNYPDKLGARIINRPSRFDRRVLVDMPSFEARRSYLKQATGEGLTDSQLDIWANDTDQMSIAHLRELVAAVYCLDQPYEDVVDRLQKMANPVKAGADGFRPKASGFMNAAQKAVAAGY